MDYELIWWLVVGGLCAIFGLIAIATPYDAPVSQETIRRICGERTH